MRNSLIVSHSLSTAEDDNVTLATEEDLLLSYCYGGLLSPMSY